MSIRQRKETSRWQFFVQQEVPFFFASATSSLPKNFSAACLFPGLLVALVCAATGISQCAKIHFLPPTLGRQCLKLAFLTNRDVDMRSAHQTRQEQIGIILAFLISQLAEKFHLAWSFLCNPKTCPYL